MEHVVAGNRRDPDGDAHAFGDRGDLRRCAIRIGGAQIADQPEAPPREHGQQRFDAFGQPAVEATGRLAPSPQLGERDRALGQAFEHQVVERAVFGERDRRVEAVAGEARPASKSQRRTHRG